MTQQVSQACAMMEGWANFMSAAVWNSGGPNADGSLRYWGSCEGNATINVEAAGASSSCVVKYMENNFASSSWPGSGSELDWMRTWWDYFTNDLAWEPGYQPSIGTMQAEWVGYLPPTSTDEFEGRAYDDYRKGVAAYSTVSGCEQYERLVWMAAANGADHCEHENLFDWCDNVPGCTNVD
ncbi:MAG: hypothetical protein HC927_08895 [Deltaproteobacteria bacterium]|nr:hypothetical protein [Deltaproteobacteria bacterium]